MLLDKFYLCNNFHRVIIFFMKTHRTCNLCGNSSLEIALITKDNFYKNNKKYKLFRCKICDLYQQNPIPSEKEILSFYPDNYLGNFVDAQSYSNLTFLYKFKRFVYKINMSIFYRYERESKEILQYQKLKKIANVNVLDIGCGSGKLLIALSNYNFKLFGIDIDPEPIKVLKENYNIDGDAVFFSNFSTDKKFDIIFAYHFLEHVSDPTLTLQKMKNLLKPGGLLFLRVPNIDSLSYKIFGKYSVILDQPRHIFMFSPKTLENFLEKVEFKNIKIETNPHLYFIESILNFFDLTSNFSSTFVSRLIYTIIVTSISSVINIISIPFRFLFSIKGEEIFIIAEN